MLENPALEDFINIEKKKIDIKYTTKSKTVPINSNIVIIVTLYEILRFLEKQKPISHVKWGKVARG